MATEVPLGLASATPSNGNKGPAVVTETPANAARVDAKGNPVHNRVLLSLTDNEYEMLAPYLEGIEMPLHKGLHDASTGFEYGFFPNHGLISLVITVSDGRSVEVGIVGREGFVGTPLAAGFSHTPYGAMVQASGNALRIKAEVLEVMLAEMPELKQRLTHYALVQSMQVAQLAACNRLHEIDQRLARWMLMCQDRLGSDLLPMTHEFFAAMLGTGRPTVSVAASVLQRAGIIQYSRGTVKIVDRSGLEAAACECYSVIQRFDH